MPHDVLCISAKPLPKNRGSIRALSGCLTWLGLLYHCFSRSRCSMHDCMVSGHKRGRTHLTGWLELGMKRLCSGLIAVFLITTISYAETDSSVSAASRVIRIQLPTNYSVLASLPFILPDDSLSHVLADLVTGTINGAGASCILKWAGLRRAYVGAVSSGSSAATAEMPMRCCEGNADVDSTSRAGSAPSLLTVKCNFRATPLFNSEKEAAR